MINPLGPVPTPLDSAADFNTKAFNLLAQLPGFVTETNATADTIQINADILAAVLLGMAFPEYAGTSASSVTVGTGPKVFATQTGKLWTVGQIVVISSGGNILRGPVVSYTGGNLTVNVTSTVGSGTYAAWTIGLTFEGLLLAKSGAIGASGLTQATSRMLGRSTAGVGAVEEISLGATLELLAGVLGVKDASIAAGKLSGAQSGSAPVFGVRAWATLDGTLSGTNAPIASGNIPTISRNSSGNYAVSFTTQMPHANYVVLVSGVSSSAVNMTVGGTRSKTTTGFILDVGSVGTGGGVPFDRSSIEILVIC